jgi:DNA polymerase elongation subunit (family B)
MALVIDIETVGEDFDKIDPTTKQILSDRAKRNIATATDDPIELARNQLGLSPYTGMIIVLGVLDTETGKGAVYYQHPGHQTEVPPSQDPVVFRICSEAEMLTNFWKLATRYQEFVTYSGRTFDLPFLMIRSAINNIRPTKDLMRGRYIYQQQASALHIDLYDQLSFYGSMNSGGLHLACRAFGIDTPKVDGIDGAKVGQFFQEKRYREIADYNHRDLLATAELYRRWQKNLAF